MAAAAHPDRVRFEGSQPILRVENMQAALRFYVDVLGFEYADWGTEDFTSISRDRAAIYLSQGDQGRAAAHGSGSAWRTPKSCTRS
jgi:catechol 2,3-dioxygenase-like lactoylglutathione lyase family enzyme